MKVKIFTAETMDEALGKMRSELGTGASIICSGKKVVRDRRGGVGIAFEVIASVGDAHPGGSNKTDNSSSQKAGSTFLSPMLDDDVEDMIDESLLETSVEETKIADNIGRKSAF